MKSIPFFPLWRTTVAVFLSLSSVSLAERSVVVWQIGTPDHSFEDFAFPEERQQYHKHFTGDADFVVGSDEATRRFPGIHPGPADDWAGSRHHTFRIRFYLDSVRPGWYVLQLDLTDTHGDKAPMLEVRINDEAAEVPLARGAGDPSILDPRKGRTCSIRFVVPAARMRPGENLIELTTIKGSWLLYDAITLRSVLPDEPPPISVFAEPTIFFIEREERLEQEYRFRVDGLATEGSVRVEIRGGGELLKAADFPAPPLGIVTDPIHVTDTPIARELVISVISGSQTAELRLEQKPQRKWRFYVLPFVHTDIGYTATQDEVAAIHNRNTDVALGLIARFPLYRWHLESSWGAQMWLRDRPVVEHQQLFEAVRQRRIGIGAPFANMLTGLCSGEELIRMLYYSARLNREHEVPFEICVLTDVPSHVWTLPSVLAGAGVRGLSVGVNQIRGPILRKNIHRQSPFWWEGPDGRRTLTWFSPEYGDAQLGHLGLRSNRDHMLKMIQNEVKSWTDRADYPYDAVLLHGAYADNARIARPLMADLISWYHDRYAYPRIILCSGSEFFDYIRENFGDRIPTVRGCGGSWWEDGAASSARETAINRNTHQAIVTAERVWSVLSHALAAGSFPQEAFDRAWDHMLLYDEHTWGSADSVRSPLSDQVQRQWAVKAGYAYKAADQVNRLLEKGLRQLAAGIKAPSGSVLVFNPSGHVRSDVVQVKLAHDEAITNDNGVVPQQEVDRDPLRCKTVAFFAKDVPAVGYRVYQVTREKSESPPQGENLLPAGLLENCFYHIEFDPGSGGVASLIDRTTGKELVDRTSPFRLGQVIHATGGEDPNGATPGNCPDPSRLTFQSLSSAHLEAGARGSVFRSVRMVNRTDLLPRVELEVVLYEEERRVDLVYRIRKAMTLRKEALYFAFPFAGDRPRFRYEIPGGTVRPNEDHLPGGCRDWLAVQRWLTVHSDGCGVAWTPVDTPLVTLCSMTPGRWLDELPITNGTVFAYVMNNYWYTNYKAGQDGEFVFRYSLTSGASMEPADALRFGESVTMPMRAICMENTPQPGASLPASMSLLRAEPDNIEVTAVKRADDGKGLIVRLRETAGQASECRIQLGVPAFTRACECDLVERVRQPLTIREGIVFCRLGPNGFATIRLE